MHLSKNSTLYMQLKHFTMLIGALLKRNSSSTCRNSLTSFELFSLDFKACCFLLLELQYYWDSQILSFQALKN